MTTTLSRADTKVLDFITANPGEIERRIGYNGAVYYYCAELGIMTRAAAVSIANLIAAKRVEVRNINRHTVGLRMPRAARAIYPVD